MRPPKSIEDEKLDELPLKFKELPARNLALDPGFREKMLKTSPRGCIALAAAMSEWVLWRVGPHTDEDVEPLIEAMWACVAHPSYLVPFDVGTWPPPGDARWDNTATTAYLRVYWAFRKLIEGMMGVQELYTITNWCYQVLETGRFKSRKNKLEAGRGRELEATFYAWLHQSADRVLAISPADASSQRLWEARPAPDAQAKVKWGQPVVREDVFGERQSPDQRIAALDELLRRVKGNPWLCPAADVATNKAWTPLKHDVPLLKGAPYTFDAAEV